MTNLPPLCEAFSPPSPDAGKHLDWDRPVGYAHAASILALLTANDNRYQVTDHA